MDATEPVLISLKMRCASRMQARPLRFIWINGGEGLAVGQGWEGIVYDQICKDDEVPCLHGTLWFRELPIESRLNCVVCSFNLSFGCSIDRAVMLFSRPGSGAHGYPLDVNVDRDNMEAL